MALQVTVMGLPAVVVFGPVNEEMTGCPGTTATILSVPAAVALFVFTTSQVIIVVLAVAGACQVTVVPRLLSSVPALADQE